MSDDLRNRVARAMRAAGEMRLALAGQVSFDSAARKWDDVAEDAHKAVFEITAIEPAPVSVREAALREIAAQKNSDELSRDEWDVADFIGGYDECINKARSALRAIAEGTD